MQQSLFKTYVAKTGKGEKIPKFNVPLRYRMKEKHNAESTELRKLF